VIFFSSFKSLFAFLGEALEEEDYDEEEEDEDEEGEEGEEEEEDPDFDPSKVKPGQNAQECKQQ
jgi:nucleosome assembly protein 1-like 1